MIHNPNLGGPEWFAFYAGVRCEMKAQGGLREAGFDAYVPTVTRKVKHARKVVVVQRPLFPRYGFVLFDMSRRGFYDVRAVQGVESLIGNQGRPMVIRASIVSDLMAAEAQGMFDDTRDPDVIQWKPGQPVRVIAGPMQGFVGKVVRSTPKGRVDMLLTMLGGERAVTIESAALAGTE